VNWTSEHRGNDASSASLELASIPELTRRARLHADAIDGRLVLLSPERGLFLNETAARILRLCDGARSLASIVEELGACHPGASSDIQRDVFAFVAELRSRGLLRLRQGAQEAS